VRGFTMSGTFLCIEHDALFSAVALIVQSGYDCFRGTRIKQKSSRAVASLTSRYAPQRPETLAAHTDTSKRHMFFTITRRPYHFRCLARVPRDDNASGNRHVNSYSNQLAHSLQQQETPWHTANPTAKATHLLKRKSCTFAPATKSIHHLAFHDPVAKSGRLSFLCTLFPLLRVSSPFPRHHTTQLAPKRGLNPCLYFNSHRCWILPAFFIRIMQLLAARRAAGKCHQKHAESETEGMDHLMGLSGACP
jgi:hypothetical protein